MSKRSELRRKARLFSFSLWMAIFSSISSAEDEAHLADTLELPSEPIVEEEIGVPYDKIASGYFGYYVGAIGGVVAWVGMSPWGVFPAIVLFPVHGAIGSSIGVQLTGDVAQQESDYGDVLKSALIGSAISLPLYLVPGIGFLAAPFVPAYFASREYMRHVRPPTHEFSAYTVAVNPFSTLWAGSRLLGSKEAFTVPFMLDIERKTKPYSFGVEIYFADFHNDWINRDWFDGQIYAQGRWDYKLYGGTLYSRWYKRDRLSGPYFGTGMQLKFEQYSHVAGDSERLGIKPGSHYYAIPFGELGYHLNFGKYTFLKTGLRIGALLELEGPGSTRNISNRQRNLELDYNLVIRTGIRW
ncbi:MAG: hypothetical protein OEZ43_06555 [Gammaproteobacteria bacterium]|nr:hypothetical protein [Gammaproteobacteria bacterium]